jgi:hypothetical protein
MNNKHSDDFAATTDIDATEATVAEHPAGSIRLSRAARIGARISVLSGLGVVAMAAVGGDISSLVSKS